MLCISSVATRADRVVYCPSSFASGDSIAQCTDTLRSTSLSDEDRADALYLRGWRYCNRRQYGEALADFDAALKLVQVRDLDANRNIFKTEESAFNYDSFMSYGDFHVGRSCALAGLERFPEALDAAAMGEQLFLSSRAKSHARAQHALVHEQKGDLEAAERTYREAIALNGGSGGQDEMDPRYELALVLVARDKISAVADILTPQRLQDYPFRKPALLLYVLDLLPADYTTKTLAKSRLALNGDGDALADYFSGRTTLKDLLAKPEDYSDVEQQDRLCVINFFLGEQALRTNRNEAIAHFQAAVATASKQLPEYMAAEAVLRRLTAE